MNTLACHYRECVAALSFCWLFESKIWLFSHDWFEPCAVSRGLKLCQASSNFSSSFGGNWALLFIIVLIDVPSGNISTLLVVRLLVLSTFHSLTSTNTMPIPSTLVMLLTEFQVVFAVTIFRKADLECIGGSRTDTLGPWNKYILFHGPKLRRRMVRSHRSFGPMKQVYTICFHSFQCWQTRDIQLRKWV